MINVGVCFGGKSVEHDISLLTYNQIISALDQKKYKIIPLYFDKDNVLRKIDLKTKIQNINGHKYKILNIKRKEKGVYIKKGLFREDKLDVVVLSMHGKGLENGTFSSFFETLGVPVTAPGIYTSSVFHNKYLTKLILKENKINTLKYEYYSQTDFLKREENILTNYSKILNKEKKLIIKPVNLGSSIGVKKCKTLDEFKEAIDVSLKYDDGFIVEECLDEFRELNQAAYLGNDEIILSKIEEVINSNDFYGFEEKYLNNSKYFKANNLNGKKSSIDNKSKDTNTQEIKVIRNLPAKINSSLKNKLNKTTKRIFEIFNDIGVMRVDYLVTGEEGKERIYVNEINVVPGSLSYYLFEAKDIYFSNLLDELIKSAIHKQEKELEKIKYFESNVLNFDKNFKIN